MSGYRSNTRNLDRMLAQGLLTEDEYEELLDEMDSRQMSAEIKGKEDRIYVPMERPKKVRRTSSKMESLD